MSITNESKALLVLCIVLLPGCMATLETNVILTKSCNLSMEIGSGFNISCCSTETSSKSVKQTIVVADSKDQNRNASLVISSDIIKLTPEKFSKFLNLVENSTVNFYELMECAEVGKQTITTGNGQNVTIHEFKSANGFCFDFAIWGIDDLNLIMMISNLDQENTTKIVKTLKFKS
ncbi:MAG: hypothetical protein A4E48_01016 [Methanosaeta sp. PtaU1.Bin060]|nr:MAG: hypothetical protein A4E48_01016 [Methanosaeta sp. PtaU1.Bin060]